LHQVWEASYAVVCDESSPDATNVGSDLSPERLACVSMKIDTSETLGAVPEPQRLIVALWVTVTGVGVGLSLLPPAEPTVAFKQVATSLLGIGLSFVVTAGARRTLRMGRKSALASVALIVIVAGTVLWAIDSWIQILPSREWPSVADFALRRYNWVFFTLLFGFQVLVLALIESTRTAASQQRELVEAQLASLRFQLNPHFLFNTLNALAGLIEEGDQAAAGEMIARLAEFFRATLADGPSALVPLERELDLIHAYLEIEQVRFGERLRVDHAVETDAMTVLVPSLILQPLVENSIKHAVSRSKGVATITIRASVHEDRLSLQVEDAGGPAHRLAHGEGLGVGLRNVSNRLHAVFGGRAQLDAVPVTDGFRTTIDLPIARARA